MGDSPFELGTDADVDRAIVTAASDASDQLRYVVGADTEMRAHMRRETSEGEYRAWAHSVFAARKSDNERLGAESFAAAASR